MRRYDRRSEDIGRQDNPRRKMKSIASTMIAWVAAWCVVCLADASEDADLLDSPTDDPDISYNNGTNCTNDFCIPDEDYIDLIIDHIFPKFSVWVLIAMHALVFVVGLVGNALVCIAVHRKQSMRTVTNYFIVNLAVADFLVLLICLPLTVLWDVTETWFFGDGLCKAVPYLQTVSVAVSILTLTFISVDRWYAICFPLKFRSTTGRAKTAIAVIWVLAIICDIPDLLVLHTIPPSHIRVKTVIYTRCDLDWSQKSQMIFTTFKLFVLYLIPLSFMSVAYWQIIRVLWRSDIPGHNLSVRASQMNEIPPPVGGNPEDQLRSRRKAAKMLVAVVLTFTICFLPVHILSILRYTITLRSNKWTVGFSLISHWLCYFNSAINPVIYNFMSGKFRQEFRRTFRDCTSSNGSHRHRAMHRADSYAYNTGNGCRSTFRSRRDPF